MFNNFEGFNVEFVMFLQHYVLFYIADPFSSHFTSSCDFLCCILF